MDDDEEILGCCFCIVGPNKWVYISPGLAALTKGSTSRATMRKSDYDSMPSVSLANCEFRIVRTKNKTIAPFDGTGGESPFTKACKVLDHLSTQKAEGIYNNSPRILSVDVMKTEFDRATV